MERDIPGATFYLATATLSVQVVERRVPCGWLANLAQSAGTAAPGRPSRRKGP